MFLSSQSPADVILQDACLLVRPSHVSLSASSSLYFQCLRLHFYANTHLKPRKFSITCDTVHRGHHPTMISQTLEGRYVDKEKLVKLLKALFGVGNFSIKVRGSYCLARELPVPNSNRPISRQDVDDSFKLSAPRKLTQVRYKAKLRQMSRRVWELLTVDLFQKNEQAQSKPD